MSNLKGLTKLTGKGDLQRKIDEKTDYINRLKVGLSTMVRNSGFENMNEFLLTFRECRNAYTDYQRQYESRKNACGNPDIPTHKDENLSDKLVRLQRKAAENHNSIGRQTKDRGQRGKVNPSILWTVLLIIQQLTQNFINIGINTNRPF